MPDSLTRWRITVRAIDSAGRVGQKTAYVRSDKPAYVMWTGPRRFRDGDALPFAIFSVHLMGISSIMGAINVRNNFV